MRRVSFIRPTTRRSPSPSAGPPPTASGRKVSTLHERRTAHFGYAPSSSSALRLLDCRRGRNRTRRPARGRVRFRHCYSRPRAKKSRPRLALVALLLRRHLLGLQLLAQLLLLLQPLARLLQVLLQLRVPLRQVLALQTVKFARHTVLARNKARARLTSFSSSSSSSSPPWTSSPPSSRSCQQYIK